ncbi:MAG: GAF domain-containing sensor histidine kinase [Acidobacteria bacterium]|nr:GAF domain-containing sensor histidine kinase [Acidobacteriota bacterium]
MPSSTHSGRNPFKPKDLIVRETLFEMYDQIFGEVDLSSVLRKTTAAVRRLFDAEQATIYLALDDTRELESITTLDNIARAIRIPIGKQSLAGFCAATGRAFVIPDAYGDLGAIDPDLRFDRSWDARTGFRTRDVACAPALFQGELRGVVQVINRKSGIFCESDLEPLESVSRFVAYALHHARLYDELATLKCLEKEKSDFMRIIVHELKSPLAASKSLAAALRFANEGNANLVSVLSRIECRLDELLGLVSDILSLSRIKGGRPLGEVTVCDLAAETRAVHAGYVQPAEAKGLHLAVDLPADPVPVRIDVQAFRLIVSNLVGNAVKYTEAGEVRTRLTREGEWAVLRVEDTGMGIPAEDIPNLFKEFYRASNARRSRVQGTGVGLAGVKELVNRFRGLMELRSEEGKGSTFTVRLPLWREAGAP